MGWVPSVLSQRLPCRCTGEEKGIFAQHHIPCSTCLSCCKAYGMPELVLGEGSLKAWPSLTHLNETAPGLMASCSDAGIVLPCPCPAGRGWSCSLADQAVGRGAPHGGELCADQVCLQGLMAPVVGAI